MDDSTADYVNTIQASRETYAAKLLRKESKGKMIDGQDPTEAIWEMPLAIDTKILVTITFGTGGPSDWIDAECSKDSYGTLGIDRATFHAVWGSSSKETCLDSSDALWQIAERYVESIDPNV